MARRRKHSPEEIVARLRQVEVLTGQDHGATEAEGRIVRQTSAAGTRAAEPACGPALEGPLSQEAAANCTLRLTRARRKSGIPAANRRSSGECRTVQTHEIRAINAQGVVSGEKWEDGPGLYIGGWKIGLSISHRGRCLPLA